MGGGCVCSRSPHRHVERMRATADLRRLRHGRRRVRPTEPAADGSAQGRLRRQPLAAAGDLVVFNAQGSDPNGDRLYYEWDRDGNGTFETAWRNPQGVSQSSLNRHYQSPGLKRVSVRVSDYPALGGGEGSVVATAYVRVFSDEEVNRHGDIIPTASFTVSVHGLTVSVDGSPSNEPNDRIVKYQWDFDEDMYVDYEDSRPESHWTISKGRRLHDRPVRL